MPRPKAARKRRVCGYPSYLLVHRIELAYYDRATLVRRHMTVTEGLVCAFALLLAGLLLPLSYGMRMTLVLALIVLAVLSLLGGGAQYLVSLIH
jgi:hypothetical protein